MIKQIINWTAGGFFRTLGKLLLFIVIGLIVGIFLSQKKINLPLISFGKVYAETGTYNTSTYNYKYQECDLTQNHCRLSTAWKVSWPSMGTISSPGTLPRLDGSPATTQLTGIGAIGFRVYLSSSQTAYNANYTYTFKWRVCESTKWDTNDTLGRLQSMSKIIGVDYNSSNSATNAIEGDTSAVGLSITDDPSSNYCWYASFTYSPPINVKYIGFYISTNGFTSMDENTGQYTPAYSGIRPGSDFRTNGLTVSYTTDATSQAIQQQTTIINNSINNVLDQVNNINDVLNDNDTTQQESDFDDLMDDLQFSSEGAIETILMLPINLIASIINPSNQNICFTLKGKQVCFPNGSIIWNRTCNASTSWWGCTSVSGLRDFFQLIAEGFILWYLLKRIVYTFEDISDPTKSKTEVMKL